MSATSSNVLGGDAAALGHSALAAGTTTTTTFGAIAYRIGAKTYTKAAGSNTATPTTDVNTGAAFVTLVDGDACVFVFGFNAAGTFQAAQGPVVENYEYQNGSAAVHFPKLPVDFCPIGYELIQCASGATDFTLGSTNQASVTGITYTFQSVAFLPNAPLAA
jgi:hypothetical protein